MKHFLQLTIHSWKLILSITIITLIVALAAGRIVLKPHNSATILLSIGSGTLTADKASSAFDQVQAADYFSETVMGWLKAPTLIQTLGVDVAARKQEKQNLVLTYDSSSRQESDHIESILKQIINRQLAAYNESNQTGYTMPVFDYSVNESQTSWSLLAFVGLCIGLAFGYFFTFSLDSIKKTLREIK